MSVGAVEGEDAAVAWVDITPAPHPHRSHRLREAVEEVFVQVPQIQRRHRRALAAATLGATDGGFALAEAWFAFRRRLFEVRHCPAMTELDDTSVGGDAVEAAAALAGRLSRAHADLMRAIRSVPQSWQDPAKVASSCLACWRLLRGDDGHLRSAVARALTLTAGSGGPQAVQLAALAADHLVADQMVTEHWSLSGPPAEPALSDWARHDLRLRDLMELVVLGPLVAFQRPAAPLPLPPDQAALDGVRAALAAASRESPALVVRCRSALTGLRSQDASIRRTRERLLRVWGRYDDMLTDLHAWLASVRGNATTARLLQAELTMVAQARDELVVMLGELG
jgi:hypothetical protein